MPQPISSRDQDIVDAAVRGFSYGDIGSRHGVSRQRVAQIVKKHVPDFDAKSAAHLRSLTTRECPVCGRTYRARKKVLTCSDECRRHLPRHWKLIDEANRVGKRAYELRKQGLTWPVISERVRRHLVTTQRLARRYAKRERLQWPLPIPR